MLICPRCRGVFDIGAENIEAILDEEGQTVGWRHVSCDESTGLNQNPTRV